MKQIIGAPARNEQFYKRHDIRKEILEAVSGGENLLISAPRRVGKTSVLLDMVDDPDNDNFAVYINTEAIEDPEEFFQTILKSILNTDRIEGFGKFNKGVKDFLTSWANKIAGINIGGFGIELNPGEKMTAYDQLSEFLTAIKLEKKKILILVDEFPITVEHIQRKHGIDGVKHFLNQNRSLRQNPFFSEKIKFVYCGSIGLFTVVKRLNATDRINDLREIKIGALRKNEAIKLINDLLSQKINIKVEKEVMDYILHKIEWWIPFYFQLLVKELSELIIYDHLQLSEKTVDTAFDKVVENGNIYIEHFKSRLVKTFEKEELNFVHAFLSVLKNRNTLNYNEMINIAEGNNIRTQTNDIIEILKYDGYIIEENQAYHFYSPILKKWWK